MKMRKILFLFIVIFFKSFISNCIANGNSVSQIITVNGVSFKMIFVAGETFKMGAQSKSTDDANYDCDALDDETPVHQVTLSDYSIGETEVTQSLWIAVMGKPINDTIYKWSNFDSGKRDTSYAWSNTYGFGDNFPAYSVSYDDVISFITKLNQLTGKRFRLPSEAEWEYAARGGNQSKKYKYAGSNILDKVAWYGCGSSPQVTASKVSTYPVKTKLPNELGIYDMSGNVMEWCSDWFGNYVNTLQTNPSGSSNGICHILRGGCYMYLANSCRVSKRSWCNPHDRYTTNGFRLVLVP
jgi:formylglycine-generating enzyme required for sulfatase activity